MNKIALIQKIAKKQPKLSLRDAGFAVDCLLNYIEHGLTTASRIEIRGFGSFSLKHRAGRSRVNLQTGDKIFSPPYRVVHFKPARELRLRVDISQQNCNRHQ